MIGARLLSFCALGVSLLAFACAWPAPALAANVVTDDVKADHSQTGSRLLPCDLAKRLKSATIGTGDPTTTTYLYDGVGKRLQASTGTAANQVTKFLWDVNHGLPQLAQERDGDSTLLRQYTYGHRRVRQTAGPSASYFLYDGLGSVVHTASNIGGAQRTYSYEPFGEIKATSGPANSMKFAGEYLDSTGLYHLRARQYNPATGRFLTRDPVPGGHAYSYVANSPTMFVDPSGLLFREIGHGLLDLAGLFPVLGEPADGINCLWYGAEGDHVDAAFSCGAALPFIGWAAVAGKWGRRGAKLADDAAEDGADVAYHYTFGEVVTSIERNGLRPGSYATPKGSLAPLQAQLDLALPPNRGLTNAVLRVDLAGLRKAGYEIRKVTRVGRSFNMPGGGYELRFPYEVPPEYISVVYR